MEIIINTTRIGACNKKTFGTLNGPKCYFKFAILSGNQLVGYGKESIDMLKDDELNIYSQMLNVLKRSYIMAGSLNFSFNLIGKKIGEITYEELESLVLLSTEPKSKRDRFVNTIWRCLAITASYNSHMAFSDFLLSASVEENQ